MNWIYCNNCFKTKQKSNTKFYCTSCCHILCKNCLRSNCTVCNRRYKTVEINSSLPESVRCHFDDIPASFERLCKAIKFQWEHRARYEENRYDYIYKYVERKKEKERLKRAIAMAAEDMRKENARILKLQNYVMQCRRYIRDKRERMKQYRFAKKNYSEAMENSANHSAYSNMFRQPDTSRLCREAFLPQKRRFHSPFGSMNISKDTGYESAEFKLPI